MHDAEADALMVFYIGLGAPEASSVHVYDVGRFVVHEQVCVDEGLVALHGGERSHRRLVEERLDPGLVIDSAVSAAYKAARPRSVISWHLIDFPLLQAQKDVPTRAIFRCQDPGRLIPRHGWEGRRRRGCM